MDISAQDQAKTSHSSLYLQNRKPLEPKAYLDLPLGAIQPKSWLLDQMHRMSSGMTGSLDSIYPEVLGVRNGWLGGNGDGWERGPYWIDGLLPLAYILNDNCLIEKVEPWIEWTLENQQEDGYIGPIPFEFEPTQEPGIQKTRRKDWWPKMVMLKVLQQHYNATKDPRVIECLTKYFRYQLKELPNRPIDYLSLWGNRRAGDNLQVVYWLYNITGDDFLLELGSLINEQTFPYTRVFMNPENHHEVERPWNYNSIKRYPFDDEEIDNLTISQWGSFHCVNLAQGLKQPIVYSQQDPDPKYMMATQKALKDLKKYHGQPQGMYGGDEPLHGKDPTRGVEFCSVSETMFSLESMLAISGELSFADHLERIAYNALPTQATDNFTARQYMQAANQIEVSDRLQSAYQTVGHYGTDFVFGVLSGYPCCTCNMHQSWPKFVQNLWYATPDGGVAALIYGPSEVELKVADGQMVQILETTGYPFREDIRFDIKLSNKASFPFHLRIPNWANRASININGITWDGPVEDNLAIIDREWSDGDVIQLTLPMDISVTQWYDFSKAIERGPLVYSLKLNERRVLKNRRDRFGAFEEVYTNDPWNYALYAQDFEDIASSFQVEEIEWDGSYPWNLSNVPIQINTRGTRIPEWKEINGLPVFPAWWGPRSEMDYEIDFDEITLVPYGCTTLRITEFPVYDLR